MQEAIIRRMRMIRPTPAQGPHPDSTAPTSTRRLWDSLPSAFHKRPSFDSRKHRLGLLFPAPRFRLRLDVVPTPNFRLCSKALTLLRRLVSDLAHPDSSAPPGFYSSALSRFSPDSPAPPPNVRSPALFLLPVSASKSPWIRPTASERLQLGFRPNLQLPTSPTAAPAPSHPGLPWASGSPPASSMAALGFLHGGPRLSPGFLRAGPDSLHGGPGSPPASSMTALASFMAAPRSPGSLHGGPWLSTGFLHG